MGCGVDDGLNAPVRRPPVLEWLPVNGISMVASFGLLTIVAVLDSGIWVKPLDEPFESGILYPIGCLTNRWHRKERRVAEVLVRWCGVESRIQRETAP